MKQNLFYLLFFLNFFYCLGQTRTIPAEIIKQNNDTLNLEIKVIVNLFEEKLIYGISFAKTVKAIDSNGNSIKIQSKDIKQLQFIDFYGKKRVFKYDGKRQLHEIIYEGFVNVYCSFYSNSQNIDFYDDNGKRIKNSYFGTGWETIKKIVKYQPILVDLIDKRELSFEETIVYILTKYEKEYLKK